MNIHFWLLHSLSMLKNKTESSYEAETKKTELTSTNPEPETCNLLIPERHYSLPQDRTAEL